MNAVLIRETPRAPTRSCPERGSMHTSRTSAVNACGAGLSPPLRTPGPARPSYGVRGGPQAEASDVAMRHSNYISAVSAVPSSLLMQQWTRAGSPSASPPAARTLLHHAECIRDRLQCSGYLPWECGCGETAWPLRGDAAAAAGDGVLRRRT